MAKVLLVDDEAELCEFLKEIFVRQNFQVLVATSGEKALAAIEKERPGAILLDLKLPDISGVEVLRRIKEISKDTIVVAMTGFSDASLAREVEQIGVYDYIYKPFNMDDIEKLAGKLSGALGSEEE